MGSGPVYWYQIFDYAVGHWFQKTAEHVLGTVLCCPGCFSLYRVDALRDVLLEYSGSVSEAYDFLTKVRWASLARLLLPSSSSSPAPSRPSFAFFLPRPISFFFPKPPPKPFFLKTKLCYCLF